MVKKKWVLEYWSELVSPLSRRVSSERKWFSSVLSSFTFAARRRGLKPSTDSATLLIQGPRGKEKKGRERERARDRETDSLVFEEKYGFLWCLCLLFHRSCLKYNCLVVLPLYLFIFFTFNPNWSRRTGSATGITAENSQALGAQLRTWHNTTITGEKSPSGDKQLTWTTWYGGMPSSCLMEGNQITELFK